MYFPLKMSFPRENFHSQATENHSILGHSILASVSKILKGGRLWESSVCNLLPGTWSLLFRLGDVLKHLGMGSEVSTGSSQGFCSIATTATGTGLTRVHRAATAKPLLTLKGRGCGLLNLASACLVWMGT